MSDKQTTNWFRDFWHSPRYEPIRRNKDGWRYHGHRFPIKGGISRVEAMGREWADVPNLIWEASCNAE